MKKTLIMVIGMVALCIHGTALKNSKKTVRVLFCLFLCSCGACINLSASDFPPGYIEKRNAVESHIAEIYEAFGDDALPEIYKVLEENIKDTMYVSLVVDRLRSLAYDPTAKSDPDVLKIMRRIIDAYNDSPLGTGWPGEYLMRKGDASDLERLPDNTGESIRYSLRATLRARLEGTNVLYFTAVARARLPEIDLDFIPSVTNVGPQAVYAREILSCYLDELLKMPRLTVETWDFYLEQTRQAASKIPAELLTIVVWFDEDGNPVCNVDLAKYGLTMPEIDLPQNVKDKIPRRARPAVEAVPLTDSAPPPHDTSTAETPCATEQSPPKSRLWLYVVIIAIGGAITAWRYLRKK